MKIILIGGHSGISNGSTRSLLDIAEQLSLKNYTVSLCSVARSEDFGVDLKSITKKNGFSQVRRSLLNIPHLVFDIFRLLFLLKRQNPDVVYLNDTPYFYLVPFIRITGVRVILHMRFSPPKGLMYKIIRSFAQYASRVVHVSRFNQAEWGLSNSVVLWNRGKHEFLVEGRHINTIKNVLILSRMSPEKGVDIALERLANSRFNLRVVGSPYYVYQKEYYEDLKSKYNSPRIEWLPETSDVKSQMSWADALVHYPRFEDPFPGVILEALASNVLIVTNGKGGISEMCSGFEGVMNIGELEERKDEKFVVERYNKYTRTFATSEEYSQQLIALFNEK